MKKIFDILEIVAAVILSKSRLLRLDREIKRYRLLNIHQFQDKKTSDTLFILGSSPSILSLSDEQWQQISQADSFALNRFAFHGHVPTYYWLELPKNIVANHFLFEEIKKKYTKRGPLFIFNYENFRGASLAFEKLPIAIKSKAFFILSRASPKTSPRVASMLKRLKKNLDNGEVDYKSFTHCRGSLFICSQIAVALGYKRIIYVGVDLKNQDYFFENLSNINAMKYKKCIDLQEKYVDRLGGGRLVHRTVRDDLVNLGVSMDALISLFKKEISDPLDVRLFVSSEASLLADSLPVYSWDDISALKR